MKCFSHPDRDAVGVCKSCQKGVCGGCAIDLGKGLACRTTCEADVRGLISLIDANMKMSPVGMKVWQSQPSTMTWTAASCIALGLTFTLWAALHEPPLLAVVGMGVVFLGWGCLQLVQALRLRSSLDKPPS